MSWPQVAALAITILFGIITASWAIIRPLIKTMFENVIVARFDSVEEKLNKVMADQKETSDKHSERIHDIEIANAEIRGGLQARGCLLIVPKVNEPTSRCSP